MIIVLGLRVDNYLNIMYFGSFSDYVVFFVEVLIFIRRLLCVKNYVSFFLFMYFI